MELLLNYTWFFFKIGRFEPIILSGFFQFELKYLGFSTMGDSSPHHFKNNQIPI